MNALTASHRELVLLGTTCSEPNGTSRYAVFGFDQVSESELRDRLASTIPQWIEPLVKETIDSIGQCRDDKERLEDYATVATDMLARGLMTGEQADRIRAALPAELAPAHSSTHAGDDVGAQLVRLAELHAHGALNDDEFTAAKAKILN
jgi:hypothetical protein